jgi:hypothetical protein
LEDNSECCDKRQYFITDIEKFITSLTVDKNHEVILGIDANEMLYDEIGESVLLVLIERCGLVDVMASVNPVDPPPPTRYDSKRRVEYMFTTSGIHKNIIRYGMLPKDSIFYSDHCALYIDIAVKPQLGPDSNRFVPRVHCKLQSLNPTIVSKYKECLKKQLAHHTIPERIDALMAVPMGSWTKKHTAAANKIDSTFGDSQEFAERKCNKEKNRIIDWSAEVSQADRIVSYWELLLPKLKGRRTSSKTLALRRRDAGTPLHPSLNADRARTKISSSRKYLSEVWSNHEELSTTHLYRRSRAIDAAEDQDPTTSKTLQNLIRDERSLQRYQKIQYVIGKKQGSKISKFMVPQDTKVPDSNTCTEWDIEQD